MMLNTRRMPMPSLEWLLYKLCSIQSAGVPTPYESTMTLSFDAAWYNIAPLKKTCLIPYTCGLCGSPGSSLNLWCLRCTATHCFVTMPVVSHSQNLKKCATAGWNCTLLCAWLLCRKSVTAAMVMCVAINIYNSSVIRYLANTGPWWNGYHACLRNKRWRFDPVRAGQ